ncbi:hypothetical protein AVEN_220906-1 [Araneus ventricosus]|uniref:Uncharacterized protein n=1 Tax=Araneus ventricosus TaxID=182803 RepID=A0A4Y2L3Y5_ARAVE|nr:hypothetical protein AVEN_220906-1 [Araneus ventricosus]
MTPRIVMEDYWSRILENYWSGILENYWSRILENYWCPLSSECWAQLMSQEFTIVGRINIPSSRHSVVQYHSVNDICNNEYIVRALYLSLHTSSHLTILMSKSLLSPLNGCLFA